MRVPSWNKDLVTPLLSHIQNLKSVIAHLELQILNIVELPENNRFPDEDSALSYLEEYFLEVAEEACRGPHNVGKETYVQECFVGDVKYKFRIDIEYNRHDKTYYYIEGYSTDLERVDYD